MKAKYKDTENQQVIALKITMFKIQMITEQNNSHFSGNRTKIVICYCTAAAA